MKDLKSTMLRLKVKRCKPVTLVDRPVHSCLQPSLVHQEEKHHKTPCTMRRRHRALWFSSCREEVILTALWPSWGLRNAEIQTDIIKAVIPPQGHQTDTALFLLAYLCVLVPAV